jgi:membrane associated rhomboid family serine protease
VTKREPILNMPAVVVLLVATMVAIHLVRQVLSPETDVGVILEMAFVPVRFVAALGADPLAALDEAASALPPDHGLLDKAIFARALIEEGGLRPWTLVSYALLHGNITHILLNMVWLSAFGSAVARRLGALRFLAFMATTATGGALAHLLTHWNDPMPLVGASAAISGCMAVAALFVFQPGGPLSGFSFRDDTAYRMPALHFRAALRDRRVVTFLALWAVTNVIVGLSSASLGLGGAIAWEAHFGGFAAGLLVFRFFDPDRKGAAEDGF